MLEAATQLQTAIAEAKARLEASLAESAAILQKAREDAQKKLNEGLAEAQKVLQKALVDAQLAYQKAIDEIAATTAQKLAALKAQLAAVAAATAALQSAQSAYASTAAGGSTKTMPYITGGTNSQGGVGTKPYGPTTNNNISITGVNLSDPYATTTSVVNAIKFGNVVVPTAPSKLASGESGAIGAASIASRTITLKGAGGGGAARGAVML
jgi:membrane protein involved in colicin uptake